MKSIYVRDVYNPKFESINETDSFSEVVNQVISKRDPYFAVLNDEQKLTGILSIHDIKSFLFETEELQNLIIAKDIAVKDFDVVKLDDTCFDVLEKMRTAGYIALPVVTPDASAKLVGMVWQKDILDAYQKDIERKDMVATMVDKIQSSNPQNEILFLEGYSISEVEVPISFIGKSIKELNIRAEYGVDVLSVKRQSRSEPEISVFPGPDFKLDKNDLLTIAGEIKRINVVKGMD